MQSAVRQPTEIAQVLFELDARQHWTPHSLELLSDARMVAGRLNGIVSGWVLTAPSKSEFDVTDLAAGGCRRLHHLKHDRFTRWSSEAIAAALMRHHADGCRLILLPGSPRGEEVAARLAEMLQTIWVPDALTFAITRTGILEITAVLPGGKLSRVLRPPSDGVAVVTMRPGVAEIKPDKSAVFEVKEILVNLDSVPQLTTVEQFIAADPKTIDLSNADRIVAAGRGVEGPAGVALAAKLAETLHASLGASRMAVDLGWVPPARQVGQTGRTVCPDLYVACGISGASHHLVGMRSSKHIIALNSDPKAPIHEVAHLSLQGDLHRVIPAVIAALQQRSKTLAGAPT